MSYQNRIFRQFFTLLFFCFVNDVLGVFNYASADDRCIAVFYPEVRKPYNKILDDIIDGIEQGVNDVKTTGWSIRKFPFKNMSFRNKIDEIIEKEKCKAAIGLGRGGMELISSIKDIPTVAGAVVVGAVLTEPNENALMPILSLMPSPDELFRRLKYYANDIKTVTVIYNPDNNQKLISKALHAAEKNNIKLIVRPAKDLNNALLLYRDFVSQLNPKHDALWLLQDRSTVDTKAILPFLLEKAWKNRFIIFSSQAVHAKHGVLFSVYPDNIELGRRIGRVTTQCLTTGCDKTTVTLLQDLQTAVNTRAAAHLNIRINKRNDPYTNIFFPQQ